MAQSYAGQPTMIELPLRDEELARTALIDFEVERDGAVPVGTLLGWKLRAMIARGALREGDRLPSVRELAGFARVNVNTVRSVYRELERDELITSEHGRGTFVTERAAQLRESAEALDESIAKADELGLGRRELGAMLYATGAQRGTEPMGHAAIPLSRPQAPVTERDARQQLRTQISRLEASLAAHSWEDRRRPSGRRAINAGPVPHMADLAELERTRDALIERLSQLRGAAQRRGAAQEAARVHVERMIADPAGHRWELVTSEQTGGDGCRNWRVVPRFGPLGAIMGWWRVKVSSGCPKPGPLAAAPHQAPGR
jgi:DNA-binding transcriptional regulator YhcF (GntR family)